MLCTAFEERDMHRFRIFFENHPFLSRLYELYLSLKAPQAQYLLEKMAKILLYNFHREHILLKLKTKKLLRKNKSKNLTAGVF